MGSVWVVLPTYNEVESLGAVVHGVRAAVPDARVLVVDDASTDGTGELAESLGVGVRDLTGGYKCFRAATLQAIDATGAGAQGYAFQVELTWRALSLGLEVVEVPIRFRERRLGDSKMSTRIALEAAWRVPALRFGPRRWRALADPAPAADPLLHEG